MRAEKTEYWYDARPNYVRRVWKDENGMFIMLNKERCEVDLEHYHFFLKKGEIPSE